MRPSKPDQQSQLEHEVLKLRLANVHTICRYVEATPAMRRRTGHYVADERVPANHPECHIYEEHDQSSSRLPSWRRRDDICDIIE
jgi:hypothetical protein